MNMKMVELSQIVECVSVRLQRIEEHFIRNALLCAG